jgi:hypothetical protein
MTWSDLLMISVCAYCLGRMGGIGVVIGGAAVLVITIMEVLRYFGFSVSGGAMTWSNLVSAGLGLGGYLLGLRGGGRKCMDEIDDVSLLTIAMATDDDEIPF